MNKISEFVARQNEYNDKMEASMEGLKADIQLLNDELAKFQNSPGEISAEDQASLDLLESRGKDLSEKLNQLDNLNPPTPPAFPV